MLDKERIDRQVKLSDVDNICGTIPMNITVNTVILAAEEFYRNRPICVTLALAQLRRKLYNQTIKETLLAKIPAEIGTLLGMIFAIIDCKLIKVCFCDSYCYNHALLMYKL